MTHIIGHLVGLSFFHALRYAIKGTKHFFVAVWREDPPDSQIPLARLEFPRAETAAMSVSVVPPELNELDGEFRGMCAVAAAAGCIWACLLATLVTRLAQNLNLYFLSGLRDPIFQIVRGVPMAMGVGVTVSLRLIPLGRIKQLAELRRNKRWRDGFLTAFLAGFIIVGAGELLLGLLGHK